MVSVREARAAAKRTWWSSITQWYTQGIACRPPGFLKLSCCFLTKFSEWGFRWASDSRSQLFFFGFWVSFAAWLGIAAAVCSISWYASIVEILPFFEGKITLSEALGGGESTLNFYAGLNILVVDSCSGPAECPPRSQSWSSVDCKELFEHCDDCADVSIQSVVTVLIALITQFPAVMSNLQRSTVFGDTPLLKIFSLVTGVIGILSLLQTMRAFGQACFRDLQPASDHVSIEREFGVALICLMAATGLKVVELVVHLLVPVPAKESVEEGEIVQMVTIDGPDGTTIQVAEVVVEESCTGSREEWHRVSVVVDEGLGEDAQVPQLVRELRRIDTGNPAIGTV